LATPLTMYEPPADAPDTPQPEARRVQVVARWNSWVQVYDPSDESLTWVEVESDEGRAPLCYPGVARRHASAPGRSAHLHPRRTGRGT